MMATRFRRALEAKGQPFDLEHLAALLECSEYQAFLLALRLPPDAPACANATQMMPELFQ